MNLVTVNHQFTRTPTKRTKTDEIVIHHQAGNPVPASTMHKWHLDRGWIGIGYNFVIQPNGTIETGRPIDTIGAHAGAGINGRSIGVCFAGNIDLKPPADPQVKAFYDLYRKVIKPRYGKLPISGHNQHMSTTCPGRHMPMERMRQEMDGDEFTVLVNGKRIDAPLKNENGRLYILLDGVPGQRHWIQLRAFADLLGAKLQWVEATKTALLTVR